MATRKIETEISLIGEKDFNDQMKKINNNLKNLDAEMRVVSTSFDENASATDKLRDKQSLLTQQIDQQKEKVRALSEMYERQKTELGEDAAATDKYRQAALKAEAALNKMETELRQTNNQLEEASKETNKTGDEAQKAAPKFKLSAEALEKIQAAGRKAGAALAPLAKDLASAAAGAVKFTAVGTVKSMAALGVAAGGAAIGVAALAAGGLKQLGALAVQQAQAGNPAFASLAENLTALSGSSEALKSSLGKALLPELTSFTAKADRLLSSFSAELEATGGDTEAMGAVMADNIRKAAQLLQEEAPAFVKAGGNLLSGLVDGIVDNADELEEAVGSVVQEISGWLEDNADSLGEAAAVMVGTLGSLITENAPGLMDAGISMVSNLVQGLNGRKLGEGAAELVSNLLVGLLELAPDLVEVGVAFIGGIVDGLIAAWPEIKEAVASFPGKIVESMKAAWDSWQGPGKEAIQAALEGMKNAWNSVVEWFNSVVAQLRGTAHINVETHYSSSGREHGGHSGSFASGLDYVPYDNFRANLHEGEFIAPKPLANALRAAGISSDSRSLEGLGSGGGQSVSVAVNFTGSLAQLARILQPEIEIATHNKGPQMSGT